MKKSVTVTFVEAIPEQLRDGVLYVSIEYATVVHKCMCGCGMEVVTPLSPTDWSLTFNGEAVSLDPSIGNWSYPCRSHYLIRNNKVCWCGDMPQDLIDVGRARDRRAKDAYYAGRSAGLPGKSTQPAVDPTSAPVPTGPTSQERMLSRFAKWLLS